MYNNSSTITQKDYNSTGRKKRGNRMNVLSVAYYSNNEAVKTAVLKSDQIRNKALKLCVQTAEYNNMSLDEKNKLYDTIVKQLTA